MKTKILLLMILLIIALGLYSSVKNLKPVENVTHDSGILSGTMTIGPICPVENIDNPCRPTAEMFAANKINVYIADRITLFTTITPNSDGKFSITLPAGDYHLSMANQASRVGGVSGLPDMITIQKDTTTTITIQVDTGIR